MAMFGLHGDAYLARLSSFLPHLWLLATVAASSWYGLQPYQLDVNAKTSVFTSSRLVQMEVRSVHMLAGASTLTLVGWLPCQPGACVEFWESIRLTQ